MPQPKNPRKRGRPTKKPNWLELPADITANILHRLGAIAILMSAQKVCSAWYKICKDPAMWRVIDMRNSGASVRKRNKISAVIKKLFKQAVNRSQGQLVDIDIEDFGTNEVIEYIADRSSHLRRIRVLSCSIEEDCWRKFFRKVPLLEQLNLPLTYISPGALEDASRYCPMLKSLKCGNIGYMLDGEIVLAIVGRMTELHRLELALYTITN